MTAHPQATTPPAISIVIPTFDRCERLQRVLQSLAEQDVDAPFEVVVVSDGSTDGTDEYLTEARLPLPVVALTQTNQGPAAARNHGVAVAGADLVLFLDDDVVADPGLVRSHLDAHHRLGHDVVVIGPMLNPPDHRMRPWVAWEQEMLAKQYDAMERGEYAATARQFYTGNASVRRHHVTDCGGFDASFRRAEDVELAFRLADQGITFHFEPTAIGLHYADRSFSSWLDTAYAYGRNDMVFARDLDRTWIFDFARESFESRRAVVRWLTRLSIHYPIAGRIALAGLGPIARSSSRLLPELIGRFARSAVYSVEYHRGVADELGSGRVALQLLGGTRPGELRRQEPGLNTTSTK